MGLEEDAIGFVALLPDDSDRPEVLRQPGDVDLALLFVRVSLGQQEQLMRGSGSNHPGHPAAIAFPRWHGPPRRQ